MANNAPIKARLAQGGDTHLRALYELIDKIHFVEQTLAGGGITPPTTTGFVVANAVFNSASNRYDVTTGQSITTLVPGHRFKLSVDMPTSLHNVNVSVDGLSPVEVKYQRGGSKYSLIPGEFDGEVEVVFDGTYFVVSGNLVVPDYTIKLTDPSPAGWLNLSTGSWVIYSITDIPAGAPFHMIGNTIISETPARWLITLRSYVRNGSVQTRFLTDTETELHEITTTTGSIFRHHKIMTLDNGATLNAARYAYSGAQENDNYNSITFTFLGRP